MQILRLHSGFMNQEDLEPGPQNLYFYKHSSTLRTHGIFKNSKVLKTLKYGKV